MSEKIKPALTDKKQSPKQSPKRNPVGTLVRQPGGRGAIYQGPAANPVAGPGRPPSAIRASMRHTLDQGVLADLLARYTAGTVDALGFANFLAKYGIGERSELSVVSPDVIAKLQEQVALIASRPEWSSEELLIALGAIWR